MSESGDRPFSPEPQERVRVPAMLQEWRSVLFLHWPYDPRSSSA